jgi:hypothetical protein
MGLSSLLIDYIIAHSKIICDMFDDPHSGMIALLDEQSQMVGSVTDVAFLHYFDQRVGKHPHYTSYQARALFVPRSCNKFLCCIV